MAEPPFDLQKVHRRFAIEMNNLAWELLEADQQSNDDTERMIHAAHAACIHWDEIGTAVNQLRGQCLLATAYALAGHADAAVRHAEKCLSLLDQTTDEQSAFDVAGAYGCASNAFRCAGNVEKASECYEKALQAASGFDHPDDKPLFDKLYPAP